MASSHLHYSFFARLFGFEIFLYRRFSNSCLSVFHFVSHCPFNFSFTVRLTSNSFLLDCFSFCLNCFCGCGQHFFGAVRRLHHFQCVSVGSLCIEFIFIVVHFLNVLFAVLVYFDVLPFADVQFVRGSCQHFFQVRGRYPGACSLHAEFITCTSSEVYCDVNYFMFLVNEPRCEVLRFSSDFPFFSFFRCSSVHTLSVSFFQFSSFPVLTCFSS